MSNIWFSKDGSSSIRWDLVATTRFNPNSESSVRQRDFPGTPDMPSFCADGLALYYEDATDAYASFRAYHKLDA